MINYRLWLRFTLVNIVFYSIFAFIYTLAFIYSSPDMRLGAAIPLFVLFIILSSNIWSHRSIKKSLDLELPILKRVKGVVFISIVGLMVVMMFSFEPIHMVDFFKKNKTEID